jgi:hypothetical protein
MQRLVVAVHSQSQGCIGGGATDGVGHLLHTADNDRIYEPAGHSHVAQAQSRRPGSIGGFYLHRLDTAQASKVSDEGRDMLLARDFTGEHVTHIEGIGPFQFGVAQRSRYGFHGQLAQGFVPVFAYFGLTNADDANVTQIRYLPEIEN